MFHQPLDKVYPTLTVDQQKTIRQLFVGRFKTEIIDVVMRVAGQPKTAEIAAASQQLIRQFVEGKIDPTPLLHELFALAREKNCNSVLTLAAEVLRMDYNVANISARAADRRAKGAALSVAAGWEKIIRRAFPTLDVQELFAEIRKGQPEIEADVPEPLPDNPRGKPRPH